MAFSVPVGQKNHLCRWKCSNDDVFYSKEVEMSMETIAILMLLTFILGLVMGVIMARPTHVH